MSPEWKGTITAIGAIKWLWKTYSFHKIVKRPINWDNDTQSDEFTAPDCWSLCCASYQMALYEDNIDGSRVWRSLYCQQLRLIRYQPLINNLAATSLRYQQEKHYTPMLFRTSKSKVRSKSAAVWYELLSALPHTRLTLTWHRIEVVEI